MAIDPIIIYGPDNRPASTGTNRLIHGSGNTPATESWPTIHEDFNKSVKVHERKFTVSASKKLYCNLGFIREAIEGKAIASTGNHLLPVYRGTDPNGKIWQDWLRNEWCPTCEITGELDWVTGKYLESTNVDHSGDIGILLTYRGDAKRPWPAIQYIPSHRIDFRIGLSQGIVQGTECEGAAPYKGLRHEDGVIFSDYGYPLAYAIMGEKPEQDRVVSRRSFFLLKEPCFIGQARGLPAFFHGILESRSVMTAQEREAFAQVIGSSIALMEQNETGAPEGPPQSGADPFDSAPTFDNPSGGISTQSYLGGLVRFFRANSGANLQMFQHTRPGEAWESFQNRLIKMATTPVFPTEMVWDMASLKGPGVRAVQGRARRFVTDRQSLLLGPAVRQITFALGIAFMTGRLPRPRKADWDKWTFTLPPKISIDDSRDSKSKLDEYFAGRTNLTAMLAEDGQELEPHLYERAWEVVAKEKIRREVSELAGIPGWEIPESAMGVAVGSAANNQAQPAETTTPENPEETETDE